MVPENTGCFKYLYVLLENTLVKVGSIGWRQET